MGDGLESHGELLEAIGQSISDAIISIDSKSTIQFANPAVEDIFGYAPEELVGEPLTVLMPERYRNQHRTGLKRYLETNERTLNWNDVQIEGSHKNGCEIPLSIAYNEFTHEGERRFVGIVRDVTERRELERALREEREFIDQSLDAMTDVFYVFDADLKLVRWNERLVDLTGYSEDELEGMSPTAFFKEEDVDQIRSAIIEMFETGETRVEAAVITAVGSHVPHELTGKLLTDQDGDPTGFVGMARDISAQKRREAELEEYANTLEALLESTREILRTSDPTEIANNTVNRIEDVLGHQLAGIWLADAEQTMLEPVAWTEPSTEVIDSPPTYTPEEPSLSWEAYESNSTQVIDDVQGVEDRLNPDTPIQSELIIPLNEHGILNIGATEKNAFSDRDVTVAKLWATTVATVLSRIRYERTLERREAELTRERDRLDEFASLVSHDLRNPLNVAAGNLELAQETGDKTYLDKVANAIDRMEEMIDEMLMLAREGKQVEEFETIDVATIAKQCWEHVETKQASLLTKGSVTIRADPQRLSRLIENIYRNAIEHGGGNVQVAIGDLEGGFYIEDDGPGIPEQHHDTVFAPGVTTRDDGTGIGLSIVKEIADAHGWEIRVTDGSDGGARVEITGVEFV